MVKGQLHSDPAVAAKTKIHVGPFDVVNTGGFDDETMKKAAEVVRKAADAMMGIGQGKVCYGDILISKTIQSKNYAAFYIPSSDEMFIRANVPGNWDTVRTVCHELTHRLQHKFLSAKRDDIIVLYAKLGSSRFTAPREDFPKPGEVYETPKGKLKVVDVDYRQQAVKYQDEEQIREQQEGGIKAMWKSPLTAWLRVIGKPPETREDYGGFITGYAKKDPDENFAEMVSFYAIGKLPKNQVAMLEPILL
jgi:hypothetical protein